MRNSLRKGTLIAGATLALVGGALALPITVQPHFAPAAVLAATNCTYTQGYWRNHPKHWPVSSLVLGKTSYTKNQLLDIFKTSPKGDATYILAHQLIAAKLNVANGASNAAVATTIVDADKWLTANKLGSAPSGATRDKGIAYADTLDRYNNGLIGPGHCDSKNNPTQAPTQPPTQAPTQPPTQVPTQVPTQAPTQVPTQAPTQVPTQAPTHAPTQVPTQVPTQLPTQAPTQPPTQVPTQVPTQAPTQVPTQAPTQAPAPKASISGTTWIDENYDSVYDADESGAPNTKVSIYRDNGDQEFDSTTDRFVTATTSNGDGHYSFSDLAAGSYWVEVPSTDMYGFSYSITSELIELQTGQAIADVDVPVQP